MILYRLEHKSTELGPWAHARVTNNFSHMGLVYKETDRRDIPAPNEDGLKREDDHIFAFTSEKNLLKHFSMNFLVTMLTRYGFRVVELQVSECKVGGRGVQAMFTKGAIIYKRTILEA